MEQNVIDFIAHAREKGMDHATIRVLLLSAGWKEKDVAQALAAEGLEMPVPQPVRAGRAREAFLYLLTFTTLYITVISLVIMLFEMIDRKFPDAAREDWYSSDYSLSTIRWSLATIIVTVPIYLGMSRLIARDIRQHPETAHSPIRRWLTYLTLFVAAVTVIFDLITVLYSFLQGDLTVRLVLKASVLFAIVAGLFLYYLSSLRTPVEDAP